MAQPDGWDPEQYDRFKAERSAPFRDLVALVRPGAGARVVDLGCGTGELTAELHRTTGAAQTLGIDSSAAMLRGAASFAGEGLTFRAGDINDFGRDGEHYDVVFSNAALQWVPNHREVLERWASAVAGGGQLAVQMPANSDHPSHTVSAQLATESPFAEELAGGPPPDPVSNVLPPEEYAELLHTLGFTDQHVRLQVYGHSLGSSADVVEWVKGTSLTRFQTRMAPAVFDRFVDEYRRRLLAAIGDVAPYFYAFKRILFWAQR